MVHHKSPSSPTLLSYLFNWYIDLWRMMYDFDSMVYTDSHIPSTALQRSANARKSLPDARCAFFSNACHTHWLCGTSSQTHSIRPAGKIVMRKWRNVCVWCVRMFMTYIRVIDICWIIHSAKWNLQSDNRSFDNIVCQCLLNQSIYHRNNKKNDRHNGNPDGGVNEIQSLHHRPLWTIKQHTIICLHQLKRQTHYELTLYALSGCDNKLPIAVKINTKIADTGAVWMTLTNVLRKVVVIDTNKTIVKILLIAVQPNWWYWTHTKRR